MRKNISLFVVAVAGLLILGSCGNNAMNLEKMDSESTVKIDPEEMKNLEKYPPMSVEDLSERILGTEWITDDSLSIKIKKDSTIVMRSPTAFGKQSRLLSWDVPSDLASFKVEYREIASRYMASFFDIYVRARRYIVFNPKTNEVSLFTTDGGSYNDQKLRQVL